MLHLQLNTKTGPHFSPLITTCSWCSQISILNRSNECHGWLRGPGWPSRTRPPQFQGSGRQATTVQLVQQWQWQRCKTSWQRCQWQKKQDLLPIVREQWTHDHMPPHSKAGVVLSRARKRRMHCLLIQLKMSQVGGTLTHQVAMRQRAPRKLQKKS